MRESGGWTLIFVHCEGGREREREGGKEGMREGKGEGVSESVREGGCGGHLSLCSVTPCCVAKYS